MSVNRRQRQRDIEVAVLAVDITQFLRQPLRSGIQRVVRELLLQWPGDIDKTVVCFDTRTAGFMRVPSEIVDYCTGQAKDPYFEIAGAASVIAQALAELAGERIELERGDRVLFPELFAGLERVQFYRRLHAAGVELYPVVYDLLAFTDPDALNVPSVDALNDYLGLLLLARQRSFISRSVHDIFHRRFLRRPAAGDAVMPLGSDSLPRQAQAPRRASPYFVCAGALDGRKGQDEVYRAFIASAACERLDMVFVGRVPSAPRPEMRELIESTHPRVSVVDDPDDRALAALIQGAQASFFISRHEGFGLPAVESLYLGTPVVVSDGLPAVSDLGAQGQIRLRSGARAELVEAMDVLAKPQQAADLQSQIAQLRLQTWPGYAAAIAAWASA